MLCSLRLFLLVSLILAGMSPPWARADDGELDHFRGRVISVRSGTMVVRTTAGTTVRLGLAEDTKVYSLAPASFSEIGLGTYVGAVAKRLIGDAFSPGKRDSEVWLHEALELRVVDEPLRGIALGSKPWDLANGSVAVHGWVDDIEVRVLSIKWGPTDYDELDVQIPADAPVQRMAQGDRRLIKRGAPVLTGAYRGPDGRYHATFVFVGINGVAPAL